MLLLLRNLKSLILSTSSVCPPVFLSFYSFPSSIQQSAKIQEYSTSCFLESPSTFLSVERQSSVPHSDEVKQPFFLYLLFFPFLLFADPFSLLLGDGSARSPCLCRSFSRACLRALKSRTQARFLIYTMKRIN